MKGPIKRLNDIYKKKNKVLYQLVCKNDLSAIKTNRSFFPTRKLMQDNFS